MIKLELTVFKILNNIWNKSKKYRNKWFRNSNAIFVTTNGLNDAKDVLINGKLFQGIGVIYISEIENWDKIKNESHWTNVVLTDSAYSRAAKHFAFAFETADLHNLLNLEYSLIRQIT